MSQEKTQEQSTQEQAQEQAAREQAEQKRLEGLNRKLDALATHYKKREVTRTVDSIVIGELAHEYVLDFIGAETESGPRRTRRAEAIKRIHNELGRFTIERIDINREIAFYQVAVVFGRATAETMPISVLKNFAPLVKRDAATETYAVGSEHADKAKKLWSRVVESKVTIAELRDKVARILNPDKPENQNNDKAEGKANGKDTTPQIESNGKLFPGSAALEAKKALASASDKYAAYKHLGQTISANELTSLVNGLADSISQDKQRLAVLQSLAVAVKRAIEQNSVRPTQANAA
jgi:hypothetical protein